MTHSADSHRTLPDLLCGAALLMLGGIVLAGWWLRTGMFVQLLPGAVAMAPKVRVNCVAPAFTDTPWMSQHFGPEYQQVISRASAGYPLQRIATPDDIAGAILGLITGGDFVTGQTLIVDGGLSLS